jgi:predicted ester cyclase
MGAARHRQRAMKEANKAVIRQHFAALAAGDADAFAATHAPDGRNHAAAPFDLSEWPSDGKPYGPDEARSTLVWLREGLPDLRAEVEELLAEGDQVVAWVRLTGTQRGPGGPVEAASGRFVDVRHAHRFKLRDGRIIEHWAVRDDLRAMVQGGIVEPPRPRGA